MNASLLAVFMGALQKYKELASGEMATIPIISPTRTQSRVIKGYISGFMNDSRLLRQMIEAETTSDITLKNHVVISVLTSDYRSIRGFSCPLVILEEAAFFYQEGARTDTEAVRAIRPSLATLDGMLCVISSPYAKSGATWEAYQRYYGVEGPVLVWNAPSRIMNPGLKQEMIDRAIQEDPEGGRSEWEGLFRSDIASFIDPVIVDQCISPGCHEIQPLDGYNYVSFCDMAGGSGQDSATMAIAHREGDLIILDLIREVKPPFSPEQCVKEFSEDLKRYKINTVRGDKWAGSWPAEKFSQNGINYEAESRSKSELYIEMLPLLNSGQVQLLDRERMRRQLIGLERRTHTGGRQSVDHPPRQHDDIINSAAGAVVNVQKAEAIGVVMAGKKSSVVRAGETFSEYELEEPLNLWNQF